jgi:hypothetical protein
LFQTYARKSYFVKSALKIAIVAWQRSSGKWVY